MIFLCLLVVYGQTNFLDTSLFSSNTFVQMNQTNVWIRQSTNLDGELGL